MRLGPYETRRVHLCDCLEGMKALPDNCVDTICTDPPYGIRFMGATWDGADIEHRAETLRSKRPRPDGRQGDKSLAQSAGTYDRSPSANRAFQAWSEEWATEALRVAKPGAILLAFGGTRTFHRLACAIEDAGWELRDNIGYPNAGCPWLMAWVFGSGFPKSLAIDKAIDEQAFRDWLDAHPEEKAKYLKQMQQAKGDSKATEHVRRKFRKEAGTWREVTARKTYPDGNPIRTASADSKAEGWRRPWMEEGGTTANRNVTAPATEAAKVWEGWGTSLKPAWEPILVAMKPLDGTFAENAEKWGVAGLNIDGARVGTEPRSTGTRNPHAESGVHGTYGLDKRTDRQQRYDENKPSARFPSNLIHNGSPEVTDLFPDQSSGGTPPSRPRDKTRHSYGKFDGQENPNGLGGSSGSAARFFYCAKASRRERNVGCEGMEEEYVLKDGTPDGIEETTKRLLGLSC